MTVRLLVPLDGSPLSEQVLPAVAQFAARVGSCAIEVLYVIDASSLPEVGSRGVVPPSYIKRAEHLAQEYVNSRAAALAGPGIQVHTTVSVGPPAPIILNMLDTGQFDYVFMATHGRSGLARAMVGSVTDRVVRESSVPVVAVHPRPEAGAEPPWPGMEAGSRELINLFARGDLLSSKASRILAERGSPAVPDLLDALAGGTGEVRRFAARTLGLIGDARALPALLSALSDEAWEIRWEAEEALVRFGEAGIKAVLESAAHDRPDERYYLGLAHVLERAPLEFLHYLKPVLQALRSPEHAVTAPIAAVKALHRIEERQVPQPTGRY